MGVRGSRHEKSVYTFGPVGRVLWTVGSLILLYLLLWPLVSLKLLRAGLINAGPAVIAPLFFAVAGVILLVWIWPRFLRDVWRPASIAGDGLTETHDQTHRESELQNCSTEQSDDLPIAQRSAPTRW